MRRESGTSTKASGEKKSRPSPLPPPVLKNFPFSTCIRPSATRRRSISREHTLWLASLFPAINRFRRKNRGELVGEERGREERGGEKAYRHWEKWCYELLLFFSPSTTETSHVCSDFSEDEELVSFELWNWYDDDLDAWVGGRKRGGRRRRKQSGSKVAFAKEKEEAYGLLYMGCLANRTTIEMIFKLIWILGCWIFLRKIYRKSASQVFYHIVNN